MTTLKTAAKETSENFDYLHLITFVRDAGQDVLILSRVTYLFLSGFPRDC